MINWKVRIRNKAFWLAMIPAVLLLIQQIGTIFGLTLDFGELGNQLKEVVNTAFFILALLGIVTDPTTEGIEDSLQALTYNEPKAKDY
jgi:phi LC3 family holin